jgi:2-polyprenyl-3-methyl-5-hydroxy-6-metoxy-1,4-benzoquinol methylase
MKNTINDDTSDRHRKKYENPSVLHQLVLGRFLDLLAKELRGFENANALDFGCGEAFFWNEMDRRGVNMRNLTGVDLRKDALEVAGKNFPQHTFLRQDLLAWETDDKYDLVIASQVLEHLPGPEKFLDRLCKLTSRQGHLLLTVPWEPFFMLSNLVRGRDIKRLGNHPEHINHWGKRTFTQFVATKAKVIKTLAVFPFILVIAQPV